MQLLKGLGVAAVFGLGLFQNVRADAEAESEAVETLTSGNFDTFIEENELVLVKFYAPWCGHCKTLAPEYEKAAQKLKESGSKVRLGKVDATVEGSLAERYAIRGYPTLKFFRSGEAEDYAGGRSADTIIEWITTMTGPAVTQVDDMAAAEKLMETENLQVAFIGTFPAASGANYDAFHKVASQHRKLGKYIAVVSSGVTEAVKAHRRDEGEIPASELTEEALVKFVSAESLPYFGPINGENFQRYHETDREMAWFCGSQMDFNAVKGAMREAAKEYREQYNMVWLDSEGYQAHAEKALGISEFPGMVLQTKTGRYIYPAFKNTVTGAEIKQFLSDVAAGKVEKSLKSEDEPTSNDEPVKVVVGKTMQEMVFHTDKDVYLMVYATWCGHCKKFSPIYEDFAKSQADNKHVLVTKMDGTLNESPVEGFDWTGFPTVFFVKAGTTTPSRYDGDRTIEGLTEHLKKHGTPSAGFADSGHSEEL